MPTPPDDQPAVHFFGLDRTALRRTLQSWGWPAFRADQLLRWVYGRSVTDPAAMSDLSLAQRRQIQQRMVVSSATIVHRQQSRDGTLKLLLAWPDGRNAETVLIPDGERRTACLSSQVGCPVGCTFCASGIGGLKGNLDAAQIVEQVFALNRVLSPARITNIVFMGMGEPLSNYSSVMQAVRVLHDPACFNIGARRITLSTVGVPGRIRDLAEEALPINLALSLHAPTEPLRRQLIPWAEHFALDDILSACRHYFNRTGREITLEYILLSGVNDRPEQARQLARLCRTLRANVNLIRYNEVESLPYLRPRAHDVVNFQQILRDAGVNAHVRKSRGRDIDAACGQLRRKQQQAVAVLPG